MRRMNVVVNKECGGRQLIACGRERAKELRKRCQRPKAKASQRPGAVAQCQVGEARKHEACEFVNEPIKLASVSWIAH